MFKGSWRVKFAKFAKFDEMNYDMTHIVSHEIRHEFLYEARHWRKFDYSFYNRNIFLMNMVSKEIL